MENVNPVSYPSLEQFENFVEQYPDAENIVAFNGHVISEPSDRDRSQETTEALKQALRAAYPSKEEIAHLVDQTWHSLNANGKSWNAHTIEQVLDDAYELGVWHKVPDEEVPAVNGVSQEDITAVVEAISSYSKAIVEELSPEEREQLHDQMLAAGIATSGAAGLTVLASYTPATNAALSHLLTTIASLVPHSGANLSAGHLLATASATLGTALTANAASGVSATITTTVASASAAIIPLIVVGAVAHRIFVAALRTAEQASSMEHEINNVTTAMIAAALATLPPSQHAILLASIVGGLVGQHLIGPGIIRQACHNFRDAAIAVYLVQNPEFVIYLAQHLKTLLVSSIKFTAEVIESSIATSTTPATTAQVATTAHAAPTAFLLPHSITAVTAHGLSHLGTVAAATIAAHPAVIATVLVGGACSAAYYYASNSEPSPSTL